MNASALQIQNARRLAPLAGNHENSKHKKGIEIGVPIPYSVTPLGGEALMGFLVFSHHQEEETP